MAMNNIEVGNADSALQAAVAMRGIGAQQMASFRNFTIQQREESIREALAKINGNLMQRKQDMAEHMFNSNDQFRRGVTGASIDAWKSNTDQFYALQRLRMTMGMKGVIDAYGHHESMMNKIIEFLREQSQRANMHDQGMQAASKAIVEQHMAGTGTPAQEGLGTSALAGAAAGAPGATEALPPTEVTPNPLASPIFDKIGQFLGVSTPAQLYNQVRGFGDGPTGWSAFTNALKNRGMKIVNTVEAPFGGNSYPGAGTMSAADGNPLNPGNMIEGADEAYRFLRGL